MPASDENHSGTFNRASSGDDNATLNKWVHGVLCGGRSLSLVSGATDGSPPLLLLVPPLKVPRVPSLVPLALVPPLNDEPLLLAESGPKLLGDPPKGEQEGTQARALSTEPPIRRRGEPSLGLI